MHITALKTKKLIKFHIKSLHKKYLNTCIWTKKLRVSNINKLKYNSRILLCLLIEEKIHIN